VPDIEHRERLINADDLSVFELFRERSRDSTRAGRQIEDHLSALERQHLDQLVAQRSANARESALVEFGGVRRIVKAGPVLMAMRVAVSMTMGMVVTVIVCMRVIMYITVLMIVMMVVVTVLRGMCMLLAVRSSVLMVVVIGAVLVSMMFAIVVKRMDVLRFVFMFVRHVRLSVFGFIQRQASAEAPVPSRHGALRTETLLGNCELFW